MSSCSLVCCCFCSGEILTADAKEPISINHNGDCSMVLSRKLNLNCKLDITSFPRDHHLCRIVVIIKNVKSDKLSVGFMKNTYGSLAESNAWHIEAPEKSISTEVSEYDFISLVLKIKRKSGYLVKKIVYPLILISFMTVCVYILPPESGERNALSMTAFLTMVLVVQYVMDQLPESDDMPVIVPVAAINMVTTAVSLFMTCVIENIYCRAGTSMRPWTRFVFLKILGRLVFVRPLLCRKSVPNNGNDQASLEERNSEDSNKRVVDDRDDWILLATVMDRYCIIAVITVAIATTYKLMVTPQQHYPSNVRSYLWVNRKVQWIFITQFLQTYFRKDV